MMKLKQSILLLVLVLLLCMGTQSSRAESAQPPYTFCRFGIGIVYSASQYDLTALGVGTYLDWSASRGANVPDSIRYLHVLRVADENFQSTLSLLPNQLRAHPGAVWIVGNEPDAEVRYQDHVTAQVYAQRYYQLATLIRDTDPTAMIGFGTVIMPTPIRLHYLSLALTELNRLMEIAPATDNLIDAFSIHNFILNEEQIYFDDNPLVPRNWGAGLPPGYNAATWPAPQPIHIGGTADETYKTYSIDTFVARLVEFRKWMADQGMRNKPLWITEYGSLFPAVGNLTLHVSEDDTANFLDATMDKMLSLKSRDFGYTPDDNRLVQHFVWYSLNDDLWRFGGSLYNPDNRNITMVGQRFIAYEPPASANLPRKPADLYIVPNSYKMYPIGRTNTGLVNYRFFLRVGNAIPSEYHTQMKVRLLDKGVLINEQTITLPRCSGQSEFQFDYNAQTPGTQHQFTVQLVLLGGNGPETKPGNDQLELPSQPLPPLYLNQLPVIAISPSNN